MTTSINIAASPSNTLNEAAPDSMSKVTDWSRYQKVGGFNKPDVVSRKVLAAPWEPVFLAEKAPFTSGWQKGEITSESLSAVFNANKIKITGVGLRTGLLVGVDVDCTDDDLTECINEVMIKTLGPDAPYRHGSKGYMALYWNETPIGKLSLAFSRNDATHKIEILGKGQQLAAFGHVKATEKSSAFDYKWLDGQSPLSIVPEFDLPQVTGETLREFLEVVKVKLIEAGCEVEENTGGSTMERADNAGQSLYPTLVDSPHQIEVMRSLLKKRKQAIEGQGGDNHALVTFEICRDHNLSPEMAFELVTEPGGWNDRCEPPWDLDELRVKLENAYKYALKPQGNKQDMLVVADEAGILDDVPCDDKRGQFVPYGRLYNPWNEYDSPVFPLETLPPAVRDFAINIAANKGGDVSAMAMCCLAAISMAIGHDNVLYLMPDNTFSVRPAIWVMLRGDSGTTKTWLERPAVEPLQQLDNKWQAEYRAAKEIVEKDEGLTKETKETALAELKRPRRLLAYDATTEALMDILSHQNSGIGIFKDELIGLILGGAKYGGDSAGISNRADLLQAHDGGSYVQDRIKRGTITVQNYSVSILGGIQPNRLSKFKNLGDDGLLQRFLPVVMKDSVLPLERPDNSATHAWQKLIERLATSTPLDRQLSTEARAEFRRLQERIHKLKKTFRDMDAFASFIGKLEGTWGSLALLLHMAWEWPTVNRVSLETARRASRIVEDFLFHHGHILYRSMGEDVQKGDKSIARVIVEALQDPEKAGKVKWRDFYRGTDCCRAEDVKPVQRLRAFTGSGWLVPVSEFDHCREWAINPAVAGFAAEAKEERRLYDEMLAAIKLKAANKKKLVEAPED